MLIGLVLTVSLPAQTTLYWDTNGSTAGAGNSDQSWSTNNAAGNRRWTTSVDGTSSTQSWTSGSFAVFSAGTDNTGNFTVSVAGTQNVAGITVQEGNPTISSGTLNFNSANPFVDVGSGLTITFNSQLSGSNGLAKVGAGTMILNNTGNNWTGAFDINAGTVQLNTSNVIPDGSAVTVASGATLQTDWGVSETLGSLAGAGTVNFRTGTLTVGNASNTTFSGVLQDSYGTLVKQGTGTLTLSGTSANSFGGALNINDGTVALAKTAGTNAVAGSAINIGDGSGAAGSAVLRLNASNQIADYTGLVTVAADGVLQLNNFSEGINTLAGTGLIDLATSGYLTVGVNSGSSTFGGTIAGTGTFEKTGSGTLTFTENIAIAGTLRLSGGTLALSDIDLSAGTLLVTGNSLIDFGGASSLNITNLTISDGVTLTIQNWADTVDYFFTQNWTGAAFDVRGDSPMNRVIFSGFAANDTKWQEYDNQITPVPEPSTYGVLLLAATGGLLAWRRRLLRQKLQTPIALDSVKVEPDLRAG